jgi:hypothetical protein
MFLRTFGRRRPPTETIYFTFMEVDLKPRHLFKKAKNELKITCTFQTILNEENSIISILKATTTIPYDVRNKTFNKALILSFMNQTSKTICNKIKEEGREWVPLPHPFVSSEIRAHHIIGFDGDFASSNSSHNPITPSAPKTFFL